jgi:hypothetical protein
LQTNTTNVQKTLRDIYSSTDWIQGKYVPMVVAERMHFPHHLGHFLDYMSMERIMLNGLSILVVGILIRGKVIILQKMYLWIIDHY